jgi:hypothetical protein
MKNKAKQFQTKEDLQAQIVYKQQKEEEFNNLEQQRHKRQELMEAAHNEKHWNIAMDKLRL